KYPIVPKQYLPVLKDSARRDPLKRSSEIYSETINYAACDELLNQVEEDKLPDLIEKDPDEISNVKPDNLIENDQINYIQMPVEEAVKKFGTQAIDAVKVQLKTILDKKTWKPRLKSELSKKQLKRLMRILVFVTEKEKGNLKARACGRGCDLDKTTYKINDISSPTANSNSLFITIDIAAREGRYIVTLDIGAAYLNANIMKETFMYVDKKTAEILIEMDPSYADYRESDGRILVQLNKALYGCPESGKLWYDCVTTFLKKIGFIPNLKDPCVYNKQTESGIQITTVFHVDDFIFTCKDLKEIEKVIKLFRDEFGEIKVNYGDEHNFLGLYIKRISENRLTVNMPKHIDNLITSYNLSNKNRICPARPNLFEIDPESPKLTAEQKEKFHSTVALALFVATKTRKDISAPVAFLTSRVKEPTIQDESKLIYLLEYLKSTKDLDLILGGPELTLLPKMYTDASFAIHSDCK
ncbi:MAG: hypothetical protein EB160_09800, partial [Nitrososphaeria archaeon]|nr:hypothetical protein [Nitrososphaeria archaeon]